jgi:hypothetical protein
MRWTLGATARRLRVSFRRGYKKFATKKNLMEEGKRALEMLESWPKDSVTTGLNVQLEPCMRLHLHIRCSFSVSAVVCACMMLWCARVVWMLVLCVSACSVRGCNGVEPYVCLRVGVVGVYLACVCPTVRFGARPRARGTRSKERHDTRPHLRPWATFISHGAD